MNEFDPRRLLEQFPLGEPTPPTIGGPTAASSALGAIGKQLGAGRNRGGDDQLIAAKTGEFVINDKAARIYGYDNLEKINNLGRDIHQTTYGPGSPNPTPADMREYIGAYDNPLRPGDIAVNRFNPWGVRAGPNSYLGDRHVADYTADWVPRNTVDVYYPPPGYGLQPRRYQEGGAVRSTGGSYDPDVEGFMSQINLDDYYAQNWEEQMDLYDRMFRRGLYQGFEPRNEPSRNEPMVTREYGPYEPMTRSMPMFTRAYQEGGPVTGDTYWDKWLQYQDSIKRFSAVPDDDYRAVREAYERHKLEKQQLGIPSWYPQRYAEGGAVGGPGRITASDYPPGLLNFGPPGGGGSSSPPGISLYPHGQNPAFQGQWPYLRHPADEPLYQNHPIGKHDFSGAGVGGFQPLPGAGAGYPGAGGSLALAGTGQPSEYGDLTYNTNQGWYFKRPIDKMYPGHDLPSSGFAMGGRVGRGGYMAYQDAVGGGGGFGGGGERRGGRFGGFGPTDTQSSWDQWEDIRNRMPPRHYVPSPPSNPINPGLAPPGFSFPSGYEPGMEGPRGLTGFPGIAGAGGPTQTENALYGIGRSIGDYVIPFWTNQS